jgi:AGZA family xanthine/uracil permease-like MFS transporter
MMGLYANNPILVTFLIGLAVTSLLVIKRVKGALIIGIAATTILALPI